MNTDNINLKSATSKALFATQWDDLVAYMEAKGLDLPADCNPETLTWNKVNRFDPPGRNKGDNPLWIKVSIAPEGHFTVSFGDWTQSDASAGYWKSWDHPGQDNATDNKLILNHHWIEKQKEEKELKRRKQQLTAERANKLWEEINSADDKPNAYLSKKQVGLHGAKQISRFRGNRICVPIYEEKGNLINLQMIQETGEKYFLRDGCTQGGRFVIGAIEETSIIYIGEGFSTMASVRQAKNQPCVIAFNAHNLLAVAKSLRKQYPRHKIVLCADNDIGNPKGNVGIVKAKEAAASVGGLLAVPEMDGRKGDFNDLHTTHGLQEVRKQLDAATEEKPRPIIHWKPDNLGSIIDTTEQLLLGSGLPIYQRSGTVVRIASLPVKSSYMVKNQNHRRLGIVAVTAPYLAEKLSSLAKWRKDGVRPIQVPESVIRGLLGRVGEWKFPELVSIVSTPTLRADGSILDTPGYDPATGIYYDPMGVVFPEVPSQPTREEAIAALGQLQDILKDFPFVKPEHESVALSTILTTLIRRSLTSAPLFGFSAPKMGSGKSLLCEVTHMIATGRRMSASTPSPDKNEFQKGLVSSLRECPETVIYDNLGFPLKSDDLCTVLTQQRYRKRVLGQSEDVDLPTCVTFMATGNNLQFAGDLSTRVLLCHLDARIERPEERTFDVDLYEEVPARRAELVVAGLTVLRAYHIAGRPGQGLREFGRFEAWGRWVRNALVWLGMTDPCESRKEIEDNDPVRLQLSAFLASVRGALGAGLFTVNDLDNIYGNNEGLSESERNLVDTLKELPIRADSKGSIGRSLGRWASRYVDRIEEGLKLEKTDVKANNKIHYRVVAVDDAGMELVEEDPVGGLGAKVEEREMPF